MEGTTKFKIIGELFKIHSRHIGIIYSSIQILKCTLYQSFVFFSFFGDIRQEYSKNILTILY